eukprot:6213319-Prymnesium_polylepis.1
MNSHLWWRGPRSALGRWQGAHALRRAVEFTAEVHGTRVVLHIQTGGDRLRIPHEAVSRRKELGFKVAEVQVGLEDAEWPSCRN